MTQVLDPKAGAAPDPAKVERFKAVMQQAQAAYSSTKPDAAPAPEPKKDQPAPQPAPKTEQPSAKTTDAAPSKDAAPAAPAWTESEMVAIKRGKTTPEELADLPEATARKIVDRLVAVDRRVGEMYGQLGEAKRKMTQATPKEEAEEGEAAPAPAAKPDKAEPKKQDDKAFEAELSKKYPLEEYGENLANVLKEQARETRSLRQEMSRRDEAEQKRAAQAYETTFQETAETVIEGLDADTYAAIGGGSSAKDLAPEDPAVEARSGVKALALDIQVGYFQATGQSLDIKDAVRMALVRQFPDAIPAPGKTKTPKKEPGESPASRAVMRPGGGRGQSVAPSAAEKLRSKRQEIFNKYGAKEV
jgi:hypothetical protein